MSIKLPIPAEQKFALSRAIIDSPAAGLYMRVREPYQHVRYINRCDAVIDGFPRSANTYASYALRWAVEPKYIVRGHTHAMATLKAAVQAGKPAMLLLRNPDHAVASFYQMLGSVSLGACFTAYARFHERCIPLKDRLYVANFEDVTNDFGQVLDGFYVNYDLDWPRYTKTEQNEATIKDIIDHANRRYNNGVLRENRVPRPSSSRLAPDAIIGGMSKKEIAAQKRAQEAYEYFRER